MTAQQSYRAQLLNSALAYAEAGWPVLALVPGTDRPAFPNHRVCDGSDWRCAVRHVGWEPRATRNPQRIEQLWRHRPYGVGIACGPAGLIVVELNPEGPTSGQATLSQLEHDHGHTLPATWAVATPTGGRHLYYQRSNRRLGNTLGAAGPGINTIAAGRYIPAAPTKVTDGDYQLIDDHQPVHLPDWFDQLLPDPRPAGAVTTRAPRPPTPPHQPPAHLTTTGAHS